jgi:hypothetical protein
MLVTTLLPGWVIGELVRRVLRKLPSQNLNPRLDKILFRAFIHFLEKLQINVWVGFVEFGE